MEFIERRIHTDHVPREQINGNNELTETILLFENAAEESVFPFTLQ